MAMTMVHERPQTHSSSKTYTFDKVFDTKSIEVDVYNAIAKPAVEEVIAGYNCTILVYGQTGSEKLSLWKASNLQNTSVGKRTQ